MTELSRKITGKKRAGSMQVEPQVEGIHLRLVFRNLEVGNRLPCGADAKFIEVERAISTYLDSHIMIDSRIVIGS